MNIASLLSASSRDHHGSEAIDDGRRRISYGDMESRVHALARGLEQQGVGAADRVAILSKNRAEYVELYFACGLRGAVLVPLSWRLRERELGVLLEDSEAVLLIAESELFSGCDQLGRECPRLRRRLVIGDRRADCESFEELYLRAQPDRSERSEVDDVTEDAVAIQMYTSGTTGRSKGALLTHANVLAMVASWLEEMPLCARSNRFLQVTPLFHVGGMLMALACVAAGARLLLHAEFLPAAAAQALAHEDVTHALFVPAMLQWLLDEPGTGEQRFPKLELVVYGAAPMPIARLERVIARLRCKLLQGYGLTETAGVLTVLRPHDHELAIEAQDRARLRSAGRAVSCCRVRVVTEEGRDTEDGEVGEVIARGANVSPGYWKMPEASAIALRGGWFHTGDLATRDSEGFITLVDRSKDMIIVGGENVYPREIEDILRTHAAVDDVAVIGIPHAAWGEEVLALVVLRTEGRASDRELVQHCRASLARFKCPTRVEFRASLPRNSAGKLQKNELREEYWRGRERRV